LGIARAQSTLPHPQWRGWIRAFVPGVLACLIPASVNAACPPPEVSTEQHRTDKTLVVTGAEAIQAAVRDANRGLGTQIIITPGTYELDRPLIINRSGITIRGQTGNRDDIVLRGQGVREGINQIILVQAADFSLANLTVGWVRQHAVQVRGETDADRPRFTNVRFVDTGQQLLKISSRDPLQPGSDDGVVEGCLFEFTNGVASNYYVAGIDVHKGNGWHVRDSVFRGIRSPSETLAEHAIHFWSNSQGTVIERNRISSSDRGIGFGLGDSPHIGGRIVNNMVHVTRDVGIGLESASGTVVANNTVLTNGYPNAIEYRFSATHNVVIQNNLTNARIQSRDGGTARLVTNVTSAQPNWFAARAPADLHLEHARISVMNKGQPIAEAALDFDCQRRPIGDSFEVGADESALEVVPTRPTRTEVENEPEAVRDVRRYAKFWLTRIFQEARQRPWTAAIVSTVLLLTVVLGLRMTRRRARPSSHRKRTSRTVDLR
jgi:parallel beta-helix repeat protein